MPETLNYLARAEGPYLLMAVAAWWTVVLAYVAVITGNSRWAEKALKPIHRIIMSVNGLLNSSLIIYCFIGSQILLHESAIISTDKRHYSYWMAGMLQMAIGALVFHTVRRRADDWWSKGPVLIGYLLFTLLYTYWLSGYIFTEVLNSFLPEWRSTKWISAEEVNALIETTGSHGNAAEARAVISSRMFSIYV